MTLVFSHFPTKQDLMNVQHWLWLESWNHYKLQNCFPWDRAGTLHLFTIKRVSRYSSFRLDTGHNNWKLSFNIFGIHSKTSLYYITQTGAVADVYLVTRAILLCMPNARLLLKTASTAYTPPSKPLWFSNAVKTVHYHRRKSLFNAVRVIVQCN